MEWIKLEDRKPPNDVYVLVAHYHHHKTHPMYFIEIASRFNDQWVDNKDGEVINFKKSIITHWMPLPDAPQ